MSFEVVKRGRVGGLRGASGADGTMAAASAAEINAGTDNTKSATALALEGSKYNGRDVTLTSGAGAPNVLTGTTSPALTEYKTGQRVIVIPAADNTGAVTLNLDGLGVKDVYGLNGTMKAGEIKTGQPVELRYTGVRWRSVTRPTASDAIASRSAALTDNYQAVTPAQMAAQTKRAPAVLSNTDVSNPNAQVLTAEPSLGAYHIGTLLDWRCGASPTQASFTLNIDGLGAKTVYAADGVTLPGLNVQAGRDYVLAVSTNNNLRIVSGLESTEEEAAAGLASHSFITPRRARAAARPEALAVTSEFLRSPAALSPTRFGPAYLRPPLDSWRTWEFFDTDLMRLIRWDGATLTFADSGAALAWHEAEPNFAGAYAALDFENNRYRLDGADVGLDAFTATDLSARISVDGLYFDGTSAHRVVLKPAFVAGLMARGAWATAVRFEEFDANVLRTIMQFTPNPAASAVESISLRRRPASGTSQLNKSLQLSVTHAGASSLDLLGTPDDFTTDPHWTYASVSPIRARLGDRDGSGENTARIAGFPTALGLGYLGGTYNSAQPMFGRIKAIAWRREERQSPIGFVRDFSRMAFNDVAFHADTPAKPWSQRFPRKSQHDPFYLELRPGDQRVRDEGGFPGRNEYEQLSHNSHGVEYWQTMSMYLLPFEFEDPTVNYLILQQQHGPVGGREPWFDIKYKDDTIPRVNIRYTPAGAADGEYYVGGSYPIDLEFLQWHHFVWHHKTGEDGFFQCWQNGRQIADYSGPTGYMAEANPGTYKFGLYRSVGAGGNYTVGAWYANPRITTEDLSDLILNPEPITLDVSQF